MLINACRYIDYHHHHHQLYHHDKILDYVEYNNKNKDDKMK